MSLAVSLSVVSLVVTLQWIWLAFDREGSRLESPSIWLMPAGSREPFLERILGDRYRERTIPTTADNASVVVISPPDKPLAVTRNDQPLPVRKDGAGRTFINALPLRRGDNVIRGVVPGAPSERRIQEDSLNVDFTSVAPAATGLLATWPTAAGRRRVLGFAAPGASVTVRESGQPPDQSLDHAYADSLGWFSTYVEVRPGQTGVLLRVEQSGANTELPLLAAAGPASFVSPSLVVRRDVTVNVAESSYTVRASATLPRELSIVADIDNRMVGAAAFFREVFGLCFRPEIRSFGSGVRGMSASTRTVLSCNDFSDGGSGVIPLRIEAQGGTATVSLEVTTPIGEPVQLIDRYSGALSDTFLKLPFDRLRIEHADDVPARVAGETRTADGVSVWEPVLDDAAWNGTERDPFVVIGVIADEDQAEAVATPPADAPDAPRTPTGRIIDRIVVLESLVPNRLRQLLFALINAIPFAGFIWILNRLPDVPARRLATQKAVTVTFLVMHVSLAVLSLFDVIIAPSLLSFVSDLAPYNTLVGRVIDALRGATFIYPFLAIGLVLLVKPVFRAVRRAEVTAWRGHHWQVHRALVWLLFWIAVALLPAAALYGRILADAAPGVVERLPILAGMLALGLLASWFVLYWLFRGVLKIGIGVKDAVAAAWAVVLLPLVSPTADALNSLSRQFVATQLVIYPFFLPERAGRYVAIAIVALLGAILLRQVIELAIRLSQDAAAWRWFQRNRRRLLIVLFVMSVPVSTGSYETSVTFTLVGVFYLLRWLLPYALLLGAAALIKTLNPGDKFILSEGELLVGALVFAWYVSGHGATLLFIPVPFLLAVFLFRNWLLIPAPAQAPPSSALVARFIDNLRAQARLEDLQKGLDKLFGQGDLKLVDYQTRLKEGQADARFAAASLQIASGNAEPRILASGPEGSPLGNARTAIRYGFLLSLPFQLVTLAQMLGQDSADFPFLQFVYALVFSVVTWILTAGIFGYFYHAIRGQNGFEKALAYALAVVAPAIPLRLLQGQSLADRGQLLDIVQVVAFVLVLALVAFDLRTLQKHRYGWRDLFTVYGLASAAYGSTIAVAVASTLGGKELLPKIWEAVQWLAGQTQ